MNDKDTTVALLREKTSQFVRERDWEQFHGPRNLAMALCVEAGELLEHFLWMEDAKSLSVVKDRAAVAMIAEEIADVTGLILGLCNSLDIDLSQAIEKKMAKNALKYPVERYKGQYRVSD